MKSRVVSLVCSTLLMIGLGCVHSAPSTSDFPDVPGSHWAAKSVADLTSKGIVSKKDGVKFNGNQYLTRYEAAVYLDRLVHYIEAGHKPLHTTVLPASKMPVIAPGLGRSAMLDLVKFGFVAPKDPILTIPSNAPITPVEMSQATSHVVVRLEDRRTVPPTADMNENI